MVKAINPIISGFHPDPSICRVGDDFYLATSTFQWFPGVQLYHSKDLVNWEEMPSPLRRVSQLDMMGDPNSGGVWGPCLSYCNGTFYLIYTNTKNFHGIFKDTPNYLVTTTDLYGDWSEPVYLNSSGFDPSMFHDDDGKKYILNMRWDSRLEKNDFSGILIQEYSETEKRLIGEPKLIFEGTSVGATEAPHLYKKNGYYYLMVAEGGTMYNHGIRMARSKDIYGPYEYDPMPLLTVRDNPAYPIQRTGHGSLVETPKGDMFIPFLCGRPVGEKGRCILGRETAICQVVWDENGWLRLKNGGIAPALEYDIDLDEVKYEPLSETEFFDFKVLPPHYKTLRIPFTDTIGSLNARKGYLRLIGRDSITSWNTQSMVARRLQHHFAESTVKMEFHPKNFQQMAGLTVMYDTYNFFYLYMSRGDHNDNVLRVFVRDSLKFYNPLMKGISIGSASVVWLKVRIEECTLTYYYSLDGKDFTPMCEPLDCSNLSDEAYCDIDHEGHTGTFIGMCCQDIAGTGERCYADFEFMSYKALK